MRVEERFATAADGTRLWWRSAGAGAPTVILTDGIGCAGYVWRRLFPALAERHRVLHWNFPGHGRSERPRDPAAVTLERCVDDLCAILDAAGARTAVLVGHSMGVQVCLETHRRAPGRVAGLVLVCGAPGRLLDTFHGGRALATVFPALKAFTLAFPGVARFTVRQLLPTELAVWIARSWEVNRDLLHRRDLERYLEDAADVDPEVFVHLLASAARHDASAHLPAVDVPTLVVAGERDTFTPMALSTRMHRAIPGSELLFLPAGSHTAPLEHAELVTLRIQKFLAERPMSR